eukprot:Hpha_TRINITY_DN24652_c0_g1::TRINITY_DN24652_c0_g1_i1::g.147426::m.147426
MDVAEVEGVPGAVVFDGVLSSGDCSRLIALAEEAGFSDLCPPYAAHAPECSRAVLKNDAARLVADELFEVLSPHLPLKGEQPAVGINSMLRVMRMAPGEGLSSHLDNFHSEPGLISRFSCLVYLTHTPGGTKFDKSGVVVGDAVGRVLLYPHHLLHHSVASRCGIRFVLRTDVMYPAPGRSVRVSSIRDVKDSAIIDGVFTPEDCRRIIALGEEAGFSDLGPLHITELRECSRAVLRGSVADAIAAELFTRLQPYLFSVGGAEPVALNNYVRILKMSSGEGLFAHQDGGLRGEGRVSLLSCVMYLTNTKGGTHFLSSGASADDSAGRVILFPHGVTHQSVANPEGVRFVLRTDVVFPVL